MTQRQSLPLKHWGLDSWPFRSLPGAGQFYPTASHNEALARIEHLVEGQRRVGVLLGEIGVGKSLLLKVAARQLSRKGAAVVLVDATGASARELLWQIACGLGTTPREDAEAPWLWRRLADRLAENSLRRVNTALLVDDAGQAGPDLVMQFGRLARLHVGPQAGWTIVLAAEPGQAVRWNDSLRGLVDLRIEIGSWSADDTTGYIQIALVDAGRLEPVFDDGALAKLHDLTGGIPRQVAQLADYSLLAGAAAGLDLIDAATIEAAAEEITWPAVTASFSM
jgi:type II secretory pathway predicted ATPase ExeA